jgi:Cytochrome c oxidase subunit Va
MYLPTILFHPSRSVKLLFEPAVEVRMPSHIDSCSRNKPLIVVLVADYSTSVRIFEALREKTENKTQYEAYCNELKPVREELGTPISPPPNISILNCLTLCRNSTEGGNVARCKMVEIECG